MTTVGKLFVIPFPTEAVPAFVAQWIVEQCGGTPVGAWVSPLALRPQAVEVFKAVRGRQEPRGAVINHPESLEADSGASISWPYLLRLVSQYPGGGNAGVIFVDTSRFWTIMALLGERARMQHPWPVMLPHSRGLYVPESAVMPLPGN